MDLGEVRGRFGVVDVIDVFEQAPFALETLVQRGAGQGGKQSDHRHLDARGHNKAILPVKGCQCVVVKADDKTREHIHPVAVDCAPTKGCFDRCSEFFWFP